MRKSGPFAGRHRFLRAVARLAHDLKICFIRQCPDQVLSEFCPCIGHHDSQVMTPSGAEPEEDRSTSLESQVTAIRC